MFRRRLARTIAALLLLLGAGTTGYQLIEGWAFFDALYMTVITLSTVGFGEVRPLSEAGRGFTVLLIIGGGTLVAYLASGS